MSNHGTSSKTFLITGATAGIGRATALYLAKRGYRVIASGRNQVALDELAREGQGLDLHIVRLDVTDVASIASARVEVDRITQGRGLDGLVNNAGYGLAAAVLEVTDADLRAQMEVNVFGLMAVTRAFAAQMIDRRAGRIVNISSVGGRVTFPMFGAYHASKYAVEALSNALRMELAPFGVGVTVVEPGPIRSDFGARSVQELSKYRRPESPYVAVYDRAEAVEAMAAKMSADPVVVCKVIERGLVARRPAARYVVPFSSSVMLWFMERMPTRVLDFVNARFLGLTRSRLLGGAPTPAALPQNG